MVLTSGFYLVSADATVAATPFAELEGAMTSALSTIADGAGA
jgi:hypothetical protein